MTTFKDHIVDEIRRIAAENGGKAPGNQAFTSATGIIESRWRGKYWARWGDALIEAGFEPNAFSTKSDSEGLLRGLIAACRRYGRFPTMAEISILRRADGSIPSPKVLQQNFQDRAGLITALAERVCGNKELLDVAAMLPVIEPPRRKTRSATKSVDGYVYLIKSGEFYKIGRSDELERRIKEIRIALPDSSALIHTIMTDDPSGIETYWHRRFADRRANGEWFRLTTEDVKAFRRRKQFQ